MKYLLFILFIGIVGCKPTQFQTIIKPFPQLEDFKSFETHSYGDERWDDCEEVYYITYGITYTGDTLMIRKKYKYNCDSYNYVNWTD